MAAGGLGVGVATSGIGVIGGRGAVERDDALVAFEELVATTGVTVRRALVAAYGREVGTEAAADAMAWAWEHRQRVSGMANPGGFLFRVGQSASRRHRRRWRTTPAAAGPSDAAPPDVDLALALDALSARQRAAVVLVHGHGHTLVDAAAVLGCSTSTLRNHLRRGLAGLRSRLELDDG